MPIIDFGTNKILFVHIPKTGGVSICSWLKNWGSICFSSMTHPSTFRCTPQHFTLADLEFLFNGKIWSESFTIVRNPYDRIASEYRWRSALRVSDDDNWLDFSDWVKYYLPMVSNDPHIYDNHLLPQATFIDSSVQIYHFEEGFSSISGRIANLCAIDNDFNGLVENASPIMDIVWDREARMLVNQFYREDFIKFRYLMV